MQEMEEPVSMQILCKASSLLSIVAIAEDEQISDRSESRSLGGCVRGASKDDVEGISSASMAVSLILDRVCMALTSLTSGASFRFYQDRHLVAFPRGTLFG
jgi:hypothetical protein